MEFLTANLINTTSMMSFDSNSTLAENIINPDKELQYWSSGYADDSLTTSIVVSFTETTTVSRIAMMEHNLKSFRIFYNGATANSIGLSNPTTTANFSTNSATSLFLALSSPINCTSLTFDLRTTIEANSEKAIGLLYIGDQVLDFSNIPNASGYTPTIEPKQIVHTMSDGGTRVHVVRTKWKAKLKIQNVSETFRDSLKSVYDTYDPVVYVPFGTGTSWDGILFEAVWVNPFDFYKYSDNAVAGGFSGSIELRETAD